VVIDDWPADRGSYGLKHSEKKKICLSTNTAWPPHDIVVKLIEAADILLNKMDYDGDDWELIHEARDRAKEQYGIT
jgi:hypothetical protein